MISIPTTGGRNRVQQIVTSWTARGSNPSAGDIFRAVNTGPEAHSASCIVGIGLFLRAKAAEA